MRTLHRLPTDPGYIGAFNWPGFALALMFFVIFNGIITQYLANHFAYQPALGTPLMDLAKGVFLYQPFSWMAWGWRNLRAAQTPEIRWTLFYSIAACFVSLLLCAGIMALSNMARTRRLSLNSEDLHGSAQWATHADVKDTGILDATSGVYVGGWQYEGKLNYLRHDGPEHILAFAPTRSGKGVSLVIPTLLAWESSAVIYDIKGENWALTSGFRAQSGHLCFKFAPAERESSSRFNPLAEIRLHTPYDVRDAQNMAAMLVHTGGEGEGGGNDSTYWTNSAEQIITGMLLHVCYAAARKGKVACLADLSYIFKRPDMTFRTSIAKVLGLGKKPGPAFEHDPNSAADPPWVTGDGSPTKTHPVVAACIREMLQKEDKDFSGVLSTASIALKIFDDPLLKVNTSASDFRVADLVNHDKPISLYLVISPADKLRLRPLVRLVFTVIVNRLSEKLDFENGQQVKNVHRLLFLIDEFPSLKKMELFADALSYMAGFGLKAYLIAQDVAQINDVYGSHESILSNCHVRVAFTPNKQETAELLSKMAGTQTVPRANYSFSGKRGSAMFGQVSASVEYAQRPLMTPDEISRLPQLVKHMDGHVTPGDMLIFLSGHRPIRGRQMLFFLNPQLLAWSKIAPPVQRWTILSGGEVVEQPPLDRTPNRVSAVEVIPEVSSPQAEPDPVRVATEEVTTTADLHPQGAVTGPQVGNFQQEAFDPSPKRQPTTTRKRKRGNNDDAQKNFDEFFGL